TGCPTQNFTPGNIDSTASAIRCADECQKDVIPPVSAHVSSLSDASSLIGRVASHTSRLISAASTFLANPSEIDFAMVSAVAPFSYCLVAPSGNLILIISISNHLGRQK